MIDTTDAWDNRELGADENFVGVADVDEDLIDQAAGMTQVVIRMPIAMVHDLESIAAHSNGGMRYQALIKHILAVFIEAQNLPEKLKEDANHE